MLRRLGRSVDASPSQVKYYRVLWESENGIKKHTFDFVWDQSKLDSILGRYVRLYGAPLDWSEQGYNGFEWEKRNANGVTVRNSVWFTDADAEDLKKLQEKTGQVVAIAPPAPPPKEEKIEALMQVLITHQLLVKDYYQY